VRDRAAAQLFGIAPDLRGRLATYVGQGADVVGDALRVLAFELGELDDTVGDWVAGNAAVRPGVWFVLGRLIENRAQELPALKVAVLEMAKPD
jgi:hypothetical protein